MIPLVSTAQFHGCMRTLFFSSGLLLAALFLLPACGNAPETPLDAVTRLRIDSITAAQIRDLRVVLDSQCQAERTAQLPVLMDSIRKVRLREIEEKLRTVPH
jgi:hypothetical protein